MKLYINPDLLAKELTDDDIDELPEVYLQAFGEDAPSDHADALKGIMEYAAELARDSMTSSDPITLTLDFVHDEDGYVVYTDAVTVVQSVAKNADGNTVFFTAMGEITLL